MHARVTRGQSPPDRLDDAIRTWSRLQEITVTQDGFRGNMFLVDREQGTWQIIGLWDSVEYIHATMTPPGAWYALITRGDVLAEPTVEIMEWAAGNPDPKR